MEQVADIAVGNLRRVDVVFDGLLREGLEDLGGAAVALGVGGGGIAEDGGTGEGDGDAVTVLKRRMSAKRKRGRSGRKDERDDEVVDFVAGVLPLGLVVVQSVEKEGKKGGV